MDQVVRRQPQQLFRFHPGNLGRLQTLYRAGRFLYNHRDSIAGGINRAQQFASSVRDSFRQSMRYARRRNFRPGGYTGPMAGSRRRPYRRTGRRFFRRYPGRRFYRRRYRSTRSFRRRGSRFATRVRRVMFQAGPKKFRSYKAGTQIKTVVYGQTVFAGFDVGLGSVNAAVPQIPWLGYLDHDIFGFFKNEFGFSTNADLEQPVTFLSKLFLTLRNQANFGCHLKVYYIKVPRNMTNAFSTEQINEIVAQFVPGLSSTDLTVSSDLRDFVGFSRYARITKTKVYQFMPGETKQFFLKTGWRTPKVLRTQIFNSRNKWTRSIVFQVTGFPLHNQTEGDGVTGAPCFIDVQTLWKMQGRYLNRGVNSTTFANDVETLGTHVGQQWQSGLPGTSYAA